MGAVVLAGSGDHHVVVVVDQLAAGSWGALLRRDHSPLRRLPQESARLLVLCFENVEHGDLLREGRLRLLLWRHLLLNRESAAVVGVHHVVLALVDVALVLSPLMKIWNGRFLARTFQRSQTNNAICGHKLAADFGDPLQ